MPASVGRVEGKATHARAACRQCVHLLDRWDNAFGYDSGARQPGTPWRPQAASTPTRKEGHQLERVRDREPRRALTELKEGFEPFGPSAGAQAVSDPASKRSTRAPPSICDECEKGPRKIWRTWRARRYCGTCYAREFDSRACPGCGQMARLPRRHPEAVCRPCEAREPCHRCRHPIERLGKFTAYGAVCAVCAPYYAAPRACDLCEEVHTRLEAVVLDGRSVHACLRCARPTYKTCPACRRHRQLQAASDG